MLASLALPPIPRLIYGPSAAVEEVPEGDYMLPLGKARIAQAGTDITLVGWGQQVRVLELAVSRWVAGWSV